MGFLEASGDVLRLFDNSGRLLGLLVLVAMIILLRFLKAPRKDDNSL
jgi:hypothetical protein